MAQSFSNVSETSQSKQILINGCVATALNYSDRAIHYGDGVFETIAVKNHIPEYLDKHLARLKLSCERLQIHFNAYQALQDEINLLANTCINEAVLKVIITRGQSGRGYYADAQQQATRIVSLHPWPNYPEEYNKIGVKVCFCKTPISRNPILAGIKHLNRLEQIMARNEWRDHFFQEGLMLDELGHVIEGTMTNIFMLKNKQMYTPDLSYSGVDGIMRNLILEQNPDCKITHLSKVDLLSADKLFLTNSIIGVWPVKMLSDKD